jgi:hypothetical protein
MATMITLEVEGIDQKMNIPTLKFDIFSDVSIRPNKDAPDEKENVFDFTSPTMYPIIVEISLPKDETRKALFTWFMERTVKDKVEFKIDYGRHEQNRVITLGKVCLLTYEESIDKDSDQLILTLIARYFTNEGEKWDRALLR